MPPSAPPLSHRLACALLAGTFTTYAPSARAVGLRGVDLLQDAPAPAAAAETNDVMVLTLDGEDREATRSLSNALRVATGTEQGPELSLVELRMTMGCATETVACMTKGGQAIGAKRLVYGRLATETGGALVVELTLLDVQQGTVENAVRQSLQPSDLEASQLQATALQLRAQLWGEKPETSRRKNGASDRTPVTSSAGARDVNTPSGTRSPKRSDDVWPAWQRIGVGVSAGLTLAALASAIATTLAIRRNGPIFNELTDAASASLRDGKPANDVDPNTSLDLCELARYEPPSEPGRVTNAAVTQVCNKGDAVADAATASWVLTGVFAATTAVFVGLSIARRKRRATAKHEQKLWSLVASPGPGGLAVVGRLRF